MKRKFTLLSIIIVLFCSCKKDNKTTAANPSPGKYLLFDADGIYNSGKSSSPSLFTSLFYSNLDGSGLTQITVPPVNYFDYRASYSFDGTKIIFVRGNEDDTDRGLYTVDNTGNNLKNITKGDEVDFASFSPDGQRIVYAKSLVSSAPYLYDIYVANADGSSEQKITSLANQNGGAADIHWSFDGKIYFAGSSDSLKAGLYAINADGSNMHYVTSNAALMAISPDGKYFLFETTTGMSICNSDGSNPKTLLNVSSSNTPDSIIGGGWSADGKEIYYSSFYGATSNFGIFKINNDGTNLTKVLNGYYEYPSIH